MSIIDDIKSVAELVQKADNIELYRKILDLQSEAMNMVQTIRDLKAENTDLKLQSQLKGTLVFDKDCYWIPRENALREGPFCSNCWDTRQQLVRMIRCGQAVFSECPTCKRPIQLEPWGPYEE